MEACNGATMSHRIPNDPERVNVNDEREAAYWCRELDCSAEELQEAVSAVGVQVADVRLHLGQASRDPSRAVDAVRG